MPAFALCLDESPSLSLGQHSLAFADTALPALCTFKFITHKENLSDLSVPLYMLNDRESETLVKTRENSIKRNISVCSFRVTKGACFFRVTGTNGVRSLI
jgi:hypothetical protein